MMRTVDVLYSVPFTPLVVVLTVLFGRDLVLLFVAIGAVSWLDVARMVRAQTQGLAQREFVIAAEVAGVHPAAILWRHIAPNLAGVVIVWLTLTIPTVILTEAFLSYLGLGAQSPLTSLGVMLADGAAQMRSRPLLQLCPALVLIALVYCCNRIGDVLRHAMATESTALLCARGYSLRRADGMPVLQELSFHLGRGEILGVVGESGSGKTQLLLSLLGLAMRGACSGGSCRFDGVELAGAGEPVYRSLRGKRIAMLFQDPLLSWNPCLTIRTQLTEVLHAHCGCVVAPPTAACVVRAADARAAEALAAVGLGAAAAAAAPVSA